MVVVRHPAVRRLPPGVRRHGAGLQASVKVKGERVFRAFSLDTADREITEWQADARAELRVRLKGLPAAGSIERDVASYLRKPDVQRMPTRAERTAHLAEWMAVFRGRRRRSIKPDEIAAARDQLLADGLAPASVNKRLRALSNLWAVLDGPRAPNPVRQVRECEEPDPEARGLPYDVIEAILAAIPETAVGVKKDGTRTMGKNIPRPSKTKARLRVIAYTGLSHQQLKALTRADVDLEAGTMRVVARRKGKRLHRARDRALPELLPLIPPAVEAFKTFDALDCWGPFSNSSMWKSFTRACATLGLDGLTPYDLRHSFLSLLYGETRDLRVTGTFGGHRSERTTKRYTIAAVAPHVAEAAEKVRAKLEADARRDTPHT